MNPDDVILMRMNPDDINLVRRAAKVHFNWAPGWNPERVKAEGYSAFLPNYELPKHGPVLGFKALSDWISATKLIWAFNSGEYIERKRKSYRPQACTSTAVHAAQFPQFEFVARKRRIWLVAMKARGQHTFGARITDLDYRLNAKWYGYRYQVIGAFHLHDEAWTFSRQELLELAGVLP